MDPKEQLPSTCTDHDLSEMLDNASRDNDLKTCEFLLKLGAANELYKINSLLYSGALNGNVEMCILAKEHGANDFNKMLEGASLMGHGDICQLAKEWGATEFDRMLKYLNEYSLIIKPGHLIVCRLAVEWGINTPEEVLKIGVKRRSEELCNLAHELGARDFDGMFNLALKNHCGNIARLAWEWKNETQ